MIFLRLIQIKRRDLAVCFFVSINIWKHIYTVCKAHCQSACDFIRRSAVSSFTQASSLYLVGDGAASRRNARARPNADLPQLSSDTVSAHAQPSIQDQPAPNCLYVHECQCSYFTFYVMHVPTLLYLFYCAKYGT